MSFTPIHIGDSGWRAVYTADFTADRLGALALALIRLKPNQKAIIGFDNRFLSKEYATYLANILLEKGWEIEVLSDLFPTPGVGFLTRQRKKNWGLVITASHNPYYYNGLKILTSEGCLIERQFIREIEKEANQILQNENIPKFNPQKTETLCSILSREEATELYLKECFQWVDLELIRKIRYPIAWDSFGGTTRPLFEKLFETLKLSNFPVQTFEEPTYQKRRLEPDEASLSFLMESVKKTASGIGLACDLDGDRFSLINEKGEYVLNNKLVSLLIWYLLEVRKERGTVYQTVSCSVLNQKICSYYGVKLEISPVGFQVMGNRMRLDPQSLLGVEETGGFAYAKHLCFKDGLIAHLLILEMLAKTQKTISELLNEMSQKFGNYFYRRADFRAEKQISLIQAVPVEKWEELTGEKILSTVELDGTKLIFPSGWILLRPSQTEPLFRVYWEFSDRFITEKLNVFLSSI